MSESVLKKFGKYFLLDRIGEGGMAEIFRARLATLDSSGRLIVIKRILGANSKNPEFLQMFKSEVQLTMRFSHPNIVQLYEAGEENHQPYIAMEFVDGRNLRQLLSKLSAKKERVPIPMACYLIEQAAQGLHYAHMFRDRITGEPLNLVHRDVSPQNILVSFDGNVKVIDFGIAKANVTGDATRAGVIKGKLSYLSPEQVMGDKLDPRSDVFALGIVAWEMLTGKRLFVADGENEFQVLKMIESCNSFVKPPSTLNSTIPKELDPIILQALTRDVNKRYQSAEDFGKAIRKVLNVHFSDFSTSDVSTFVKKVFQDHIIEDRKNLQQLSTRAEDLIRLTEIVQSNQLSMQESASSSTPSSAADAAVPQHLIKKGIDLELKEETKMNPMGTGLSEIEIATPKRQFHVGPQQHRTRTFPSGPIQVSYDPYPEESEQSSGSFFGKVLVLSFLAAISFGGYYFWTRGGEGLDQQWKSILASIDQKDAEEKNTEKKSIADRSPSVANDPLAAKTVNIRLNIFPGGQIGNTRMWINSKPVDPAKRVFPVVVGELIDLKIERPGYSTYRQEFSIRDSDTVGGEEVVRDIRLDSMKYGKLSLDSVPSFADVRIIRTDQDRRSPGSVANYMDSLVLKTPFIGERLPAGTYRVIVEIKALRMEKTLNVTIEEGREYRTPDVRLEVKK